MSWECIQMEFRLPLLPPRVLPAGVVLLVLLLCPLEVPCLASSDVSAMLRSTAKEYSLLVQNRNLTSKAYNFYNRFSSNPNSQSS